MSFWSLGGVLLVESCAAFVEFKVTARQGESLMRALLVFRTFLPKESLAVSVLPSRANDRFPA